MNNKRERGNLQRMNKSKDFSKPILQVFLSYFGAHKKLFFLDMICAFAVAGIDIAFPIVSRYAMNELLPYSLYRTFFIIMAVMTGCFVVRSCFNYIITYLGHQFGIRVEADIREDLYAHFQDLEFDFFDENRTGKLMSRMTGDLFEITELAHHGPEDLLISLVTITGALIVMFSIEWRLALVVMFVIPAFVFIVILCRKNMMNSSAGVKRRLADINADIEASLSGMKTSKAFDNKQVDYARFTRTNSMYKSSKGDYYKAMAMFNASMEFAVCFLQVVVIAFGGYLIMRGRLNYVDLITFMLYITTFISPIKKLAAFAEMFTNGFAGLKRFIQIMRIEPSIKEAQDAIELGVKAHTRNAAHNSAEAWQEAGIQNAAHTMHGNISLKDVSFSYKNSPDVLKDINLEIKAGDCVAVVGHSGGGKSTLCQLIPRFYDVTEGVIMIDGIDIRKVTKSSLRRSIGIVQQDVFLFADTIYENIRYGRPSATAEEIYEAAKKAEIYDEIMQMTNGFETYVGERGTLLSGGQKQRISIARIFLKNPPILILDEATSALDSITEEQIRKSFEELAEGRTTIMIAHRLATVKNANKIVLIEDGAIMEQGSHQELIAKNGKYAKLYKAQSLR